MVKGLSRVFWIVGPLKRFLLTKEWPYAIGWATHFNPWWTGTANLVAILSRVLDLPDGESMGHAICTCWIGMQMADRLHVPQNQQAGLYYVLLLKDAGCSANAEAISPF